jgi:hypothetical protein
MADQRSQTLQPPGGGSTFDPMIEARVASLEADVRHIRDSVGEMKLDLREVRTDLKELRSDMQAMRAASQSDALVMRADMQSEIGELKVSYATLSERMAHLPTKGYIGWWITLGLSAAVAALTILSRLGFLVAK